MPRDTFILEQDLAPGIIIDTALKPGSNVEKLANKKVIDPLIVTGVSLVGSLSRFDFELLDQPHASGPTDIGIVTTLQHSLFNGDSNLGVLDGNSRDVRGNLAQVPAIFDPVSMTIGSNIGVANTPAAFGVGDIVRIQGQGTVSDYIARVSAIAGPNLTFVDPVTAAPLPFLVGPTGLYNMERVRRWVMSWVDSLAAAFALIAGTYAVGFQKRIYLADVPENYGSPKVPNQAEVPQAGGGGGGGSPTEDDKALVPTPTVGDNQTTGLTITNTPSSGGYVRISINGVGQVLGDGIKTKDCYFSVDGGVTAKAINAIVAGDTLYWNGVIAGYNLSALDLVDMEYNA